jgi:hypothetical protein
MSAIYRYGERVLLGPEGDRIEAMVIGVELRGPGYAQVMYLVTWWNDRDRQCEWLDACEVERADEAAPRARIVEDGA